MSRLRYWLLGSLCLLFIIGAARQSLDGQEKDVKPSIDGPRYLAYDHNSVIHLYDRMAADKHVHVPTDAEESHPFTLHPSLSANGEYAVFSGLRVLGAKAGNAKRHKYSLDLFLWDQKKGALHLLTDANSYAHDDHPSISADGNLIAFRTLEETAVKTAGIRLFNRKTDKFLDLPNLSFHSNTGIPCLSPDGRYLFFSAQTVKGDRDVYLYDRESAKLIDLPNVNSTVDEWSARVSKGGRWLAFCSRRPDVKAQGEATARVFLYDRDSSKFFDLPNLNLQAKHLECDLSSDGRFLALVIDRKELRLYDRQTGKLVEMPRLAHQGRGIVYAALSRE